MILAGKRIGLGSLSLLLFVCGVLFASNLGDQCYGDVALRYLGLRAWSNGIDGFHCTIFYSLIFFIPSLMLGSRFNAQWGASAGKILPLFACMITGVLFVFFMISISL